MRTLYFEGAGCPQPGVPLGNCRIRTAFHLDDGRAVYLELTGGERRGNFAPSVYRWPYTAFVTACHLITGDPDDANINRLLQGGDAEEQEAAAAVFRDGAVLRKIETPEEREAWAAAASVYRRRFVEHNTHFEYSREGILSFLRDLGASFDEIKVLPPLGGYRVFPEEGRGYYYGDEFEFSAELTALREGVFDYYTDLERREGKACPNFSLWVDEFDPAALHLIRSFPGENRHWEIKVNKGASLSDTIATARETRLGKMAC